MAVVYAKTAVQVPPIVVPTTIFNPALASPPASSPLVMRTLPPVWVPVVNTAIAQADLSGRLGSPGGYGILWGYDLLDKDTYGLPVTQGVVQIDKPAMLPRLGNTDPTVPSGNPDDIATHVPLVDDADNHIWVMQGGGLHSPVLDSLVPPSGAVAYAGLANMASGVLTRDYSGRLYRCLGGPWERKTSDTGMPADAPAGGFWFINHSLGDDSDWLWNGVAYEPIIVAGGGFPDILDRFDVATPAQITGNQNDYSLAAIAGTFRLSTDASRNVTGFAGGSAGRRVTIFNVGSHDLVATNQDAASTAANRVITGTGASITVAADGVLRLEYDGIASRWRAA